LGDEEGGLADLTRAVELEPGAPTSAEELADVLYVRGRYQEAAEYYLRAVDAGSQDAGARHRLASCLVQLNRPDEALAHLEAAITVDSENGEARLLLGTLLNADGRHAEAERELRAARPHIDADGDYFTELGYALLSQDNLDETERVAREFLGFDPGDARAHTLLGEVFLHQRQYEPARIELIRALQTNAKEPRAQIALGRTWLAIGKSRRDRGDLGKARQILESAQEVPEGERLMVLGQVALAEGSVREAVTLLEQSLGIGASELPARLSLADAKARAKDLTGAAAELERARLLSSADPAIPLSLAIAYSQLKDPVRASAEYLKAIQMVGPSTTDSVVIPSPYVSVPRRFDINRSIRSAYRAALSQNEEEPNATALKTLAESTSFVIEKDS
jgi:tetratricopeptide (TPR) repeat protein